MQPRVYSDIIALLFVLCAEDSAGQTRVTDEGMTEHPMGSLGCYDLGSSRRVS